ncbi:transglycosylase domain-containing protein [Streptomyces sp. NRRL F-5135]|uniref:transglycosylase domain-containing protein n=1 Tax=Streptomyces sp. NRRL F-5135 TaxID=1463858 RepID=UPI0007C5CC4D|nr:transglycosylase domain-containing protein [Streptomyces sp. NRRL F-5135]
MPESDEPQRQGAPADPDQADQADQPGSTAEADAAPDRATGADGTKRPKKRERPRRTGWHRLVPTWRVTLCAFLVGGLALVAGFVVGYKVVDIPAANVAATAQSNVYLYRDGTHIARDGEINRENVRLVQVPDTVQHAVLAAEDRGFYNEPAVDPQGMIRAAWNTAMGKGTQGGSTITQQYVKNYYLGQEQTIVRKTKEFFIAIKLNREVSKERILQGYLNTSYFGRNAYGIQAAAQAYYSKDVEDLTTAEGAYLASLLNAPSEFDVVVHPENRQSAVARWNYVLDGMVTENWLTPAERAVQKFPVPGKIKHTTVGLSGQRGYVVKVVEHYLHSHGILDEKTLARGGYRITTTLERKKQDALGRAVKDQVTSQLDGERPPDRNVRVGGASIDPRTGRVVAMYGGIDYTKQFVNNATRRDYQVGSTFKPFVLAAAVQHGARTLDGRRVTPNTMYDGTNERMVEGRDGPTDYSPANEDEKDYGSITVREATDKSVNAVYAQLAQDVGPALVRDTAIALGIPPATPDLTASPSIALGPATASVLDMAQAYATLANHGERVPYTLVAKITRNGTSVPLPDRPATRAISREAADTTTSVLQGVVRGGTGTAAGAAGRPAAGKTGTAEDDKAAWFAGYTPELATVVSLMGADPKTAQQKPLYGALGQARINGGGPPAQIWGQYTAAALRGTAVQNFDLRLAPGAEESASPDPERSGASRSPGASRPPGASGSPGPSEQGRTEEDGTTGGRTDGGDTGEGGNGGRPGTGGVGDSGGDDRGGPAPSPEGRGPDGNPGRPPGEGPRDDGRPRGPHEGGAGGGTTSADTDDDNDDGSGADGTAGGAGSGGVKGSSGRGSGKSGGKGSGSAESATARTPEATASDT